MTTKSVTKPAKTFNIPSLDGIRALSFLIVFVAHDHFKPVPGLFGVGVFFFLSGYLITTLMRIEIENTGTLSLEGFYLRRAFRILPPFYLVLMLIILVVKAGVLPGYFDSADLAASVLYATNFWNIYVHPIQMPGFNIFWSLAVEEHFYLVFPFLMLLMIRLKLARRSQVSILLAICTAVLIWRCILVFHLHSLDMVFGPVTDPLRTMYGTDTRIDSILFGCVLALWGNPVLDDKPKHSWTLVIAGVLTLFGTFVYRNLVFRETIRYTLQSLALIPLFIAAIRLHDHWAFRWLNSRPLRFIGVLSYTLYLVHFPILKIVERWSSNRVAVGVVAMSISLVVAYIMHVLVEKPLARFRRRFGSRTAEVLTQPVVEVAVAG
jgi:peptidoglycan/LPS O-acetylase OafA/YrhL